MPQAWSAARPAWSAAVFEFLDQVMQGPWMHSQWIWPTLFGIVCADALVQCLPSATLVILAGVSAASGRLNLGWVIVTVALAAFAGDNLVFSLGRRAGPWASRRFEKGGRGGRGARWYAWARQTITTQTVTVILFGRYISGARLAVMMTAGAAGLQRQRFIRIAGCAAPLWACTTAMTGYLGGAVFARQPTAGVAMAFAIGSVIAGASRLAVKVRSDSVTGAGRPHD